ncbi:hypothetical protein BDN71DRAFT_679177 [Pleurotus eryngii]|uniref:Uncharacterized protein n=1 Tax=Pleurotus eryngii TaxID=5323 RepID=A0A9P5ZHC7_PLEER|nr:hypothetical protein BDN71DRAFT_679177 [Pleurotus eryngii]
MSPLWPRRSHILEKLRCGRHYCTSRCNWSIFNTRLLVHMAVAGSLTRKDGAAGLAWQDSGAGMPSRGESPFAAKILVLSKKLIRVLPVVVMMAYKNNLRGSK